MLEIMFSIASSSVLYSLRALFRGLVSVAAFSPEKVKAPLMVAIKAEYTIAFRPLPRGSC